MDSREPFNDVAAAKTAAANGFDIETFFRNCYPRAVIGRGAILPG